jgi:four helix bundle protein
MKEDNIVQVKSFNFALRAVKVYKVLSLERKEYILSKQFQRSATSIGANIEEAIGGQSKADFISKISIAYKEARETIYWIRLLEGGEYLSKKETESLISDTEELLRIIGTIQKSSKIRNS